MVEDAVEDGFDQVTTTGNQSGVGSGSEGLDFSGLLSAFTGKQQGGLQSVLGLLAQGGLEKKATEMGCDPALVKCITGMLGIGGGEGEVSGGGGVNMGSLAQVAQSLTKGGGGSGGGSGNGFLGLLSGLGGGGSGSSSNILQIIIGLAKSFFAMQMGKNKNLQDWGAAGVTPGKDDDNFGNYGDHLVKDLINPGKKDKDAMDDDPKDHDTGGDDSVKGWFDKHPEIGKMQKDVMDDIFDTTDEDDEDRLDDDPTPLIPSPKGFEDGCSKLDQASLLFLNTNVLLDLRKEWRFLYSSEKHSKNWEEFFSRIELQGPTIVVIKSTDGNMFGMFTSTSWAHCEGGWIGNGDSFIFAIKPKMAVFYSTGKDDNILHCSSDNGLAMGGRIGRFGISLSSSLESGTYHEDIDTFDLPALLPEEFSVEHVEVWGLGSETDPSTEQAKLHVRRPNVQIRSGDADMDDLMDQIM